MTRGWFDLFRDDGGPTLYAYSNRTSVIGDSTSITLYIVFATLFIAFFVVFPGIRKEVSECLARTQLIHNRLMADLSEFVPKI